MVHADSRYALSHDGAHIRPRPPQPKLRTKSLHGLAQAFQRGQSVSFGLSRRLRQIQTERLHPLAAAVRLHSHHDVLQLGPVGIPVAQAAPQAVLLVGPQHHADGALGLQAQGLDQAGGFHGEDDASAVILGALAHIPAVQVAAEDDDLLGLLAAAELAHHVGGGGVRQGLSAHLQAQADALAPVLHAVQLSGGLDGDGGGGDLGVGRVVVHDAGVGGVQADRAHGAHQGGHGAKLGGAGGPGVPVGHGVAVALEGHIVEDDLALHRRAQLLQLIEGAHHHHVGSDAFLGRPDAAPQAQDVQGPAGRLQQLGGLLAPHPVGHHDRLGVDIHQAGGLHAGLGPGDGLVQLGRAREAVADAVAEPGQVLVGPVGARGLRPQALRGRAQVFGRRLGAQTDGGQTGEEKAGREHPPILAGPSPAVTENPCASGL